jgi:glycosyltransferase involved in cell wall biosynthesis
VHVWLINPYGPIPGEGWRDYRFTYAARALAARGHDVTWWTAAFDHHTKRFRARDWERRDGGAISIELVPTPGYARNISARRLWFERIFARRVLARGRALPRPNVIIAADPPQFCGAAGRKLAKVHKAPLVIDCLDLWPELFVNASPRALRPAMRLAVLPLQAMRRRNVRAASLVIAVADQYREALVADGASNAITIPVGVDVQALRSPRLPHERLTLVYAGSLGEHYDVATVFEAVRGMDVDVVIAGRGPAEAHLRSVAPPNVRFLGVLAPDELKHLYASADIGLAPYTAGSTVALPLKLFDYFAAGLPVITSLDAVDANGAVEHYVAGDASSLHAAIARVAANREAMSHAASSAAEPFDTHVLYARYADAIEALAR